MVTWQSQGLPKELEQSGTLGPSPSSRNLSLSLPLSHFNSHLSCVVSNPVDEKKETLYLESICPRRGECHLLGRGWKWAGRDMGRARLGGQFIRCKQFRAVYRMQTKSPHLGE